MPGSPALLRLLRVRAMEEQQRHLALDCALAELRTLEKALAAAEERKRKGQALLARSFGASDPTDRAAAHVEIDASLRRAAALAPRLSAAQLSVTRARQEYLAKRIERRQVETLIEAARAQQSLESNRHTQQHLDETFGARRHSRQRAERHRPQD